MCESVYLCECVYVRVSVSDYMCVWELCECCV